MRRRTLVKLLSAVIVALFTLVANLMASEPEVQATASFLPDDRLLPVLIEDINNAKTSIDIAIYMFKTDEEKNDRSLALQEALFDAAKRKVDVTVTFDVDRPDDLTTKFNKETGKEFQKAGVKVRYDSKSVRMHAKLLVIDSRITYIGSHNYTHSALARNRETTVRLVSPEIAVSATEWMESIK